MKKIVRIAIGFLLAGMIAHAQNPQTQIAPIYAVNAKYTNGVAPGYYPTKGSGLVLNVGPGTANCAGTIIAYAGGTLTLTASMTNYIYLNTSASCAPATKTTAFTSSDIPLAVAVAGSSTITSITDDRTMFFPSGAQGACGSNPCPIASGGTGATTASGALANLGGAPLTGTGTSGTWPISTTGNAATATNVPYSGLTGTVPTWNQSTTGNAATATNVTGTVAIANGGTGASTAQAAATAIVTNNAIAPSAVTVANMDLASQQTSATVPVVYDHFTSNATDGTLIQGRTADSGNSVWNVGGSAGSSIAAINNNSLVNTASPSSPTGFYASLLNTATIGGTPQPVQEVGVVYVVCPATLGTYDPTKMEGALMADDAAEDLANMLHLNFGPEGWGLGKEVSGGGIVGVTGMGNSYTPEPADCVTRHRFVMDVDATACTVSVIDPTGAQFTAYDPDICTINPKSGTWEIANETGYAQLKDREVWLGGKSQADKLTSQGQAADVADVGRLQGKLGTARYPYPTIVIPTLAGGGGSKWYEIAYQSIFGSYSVAGDFTVTAQFSYGNQILRFHVDSGGAGEPTIVEDENLQGVVVDQLAFGNDGAGNIGLYVHLLGWADTYPVTLNILGIGIMSEPTTFPPVSTLPFTNPTIITVTTPTAPLNQSYVGGSGWYTAFTGFSLSGNYQLTTTFAGGQDLLNFYIYATPSGCEVPTQVYSTTGVIDGIRCSGDAGLNTQIEVHAPSSFPFTLTGSIPAGVAAAASPAVGSTPLTGGATASLYPLTFGAGSSAGLQGTPNVAVSGATGYGNFNIVPLPTISAPTVTFSHGSAAGQGYIGSSGGTGYLSTDVGSLLTIPCGATYAIATVTGGAVTSIAVNPTYASSGCSPATNLTTTGGSGSGALINLNSTTGGVLADGVYGYKIFAVGQNGGYTAASAETTATLSGGGGYGAATIVFSTIPGAQQYVLCGRTAGGELQMAGGFTISNIPPGAVQLSFDDLGTFTPTGACPSSNTTQGAFEYNGAPIGGGSMTWPSTPGIPICTGTPCTAWGTTLTKFGSAVGIATTSDPGATAEVPIVADGSHGEKPSASGALGTAAFSATSAFDVAGAAALRAGTGNCPGGEYETGDTTSGPSCGTPSGAGNMNDGSGSSTAGLFPETTTTPESYSLSTPAQVLSQIGGAAVVVNTIPETGDFSATCSNEYLETISSPATVTLPASISTGCIIVVVNSSLSTASFTLATGGPTLACSQGTSTSCVVAIGRGTFVNTDGTKWLAEIGPVKLPVGAGYASGANGDCGYDTTNLNWHCWQNGADNFMAVFPVGSPPTSGHLVGFLKSTNSWSFEDLGAPPATSTTVNGQTCSLGSTCNVEAATSGQIAVSGGSGAALTGAADLTYSTHTFSTTASGILDLSAATGTAALKVPSNSSNTATAAGVIDFDTTNKNFHGYVDGADSIFLGIASAPTNNHVLIAAVSSGNILAGDAGFAYTAYPAADIAAGTIATGFTFAGAQYFSGSLETSAEYDNGTCTTSKTIVAANGNRQKVTLTNADTCALTFTQPANGTISITLKVIQSAVSTYNGTISGCKWPGGTVPTITATTGAIDFISIYLDGTNAYCAALQAFS